MLAASPALFPSVASARAQQNNPAPVTKREEERQTERERESKGRPERRAVKSREFQFCRVTSGSYVMQVFSFCLPHPGFDTDCMKHDGNAERRVYPLFIKTASI